MVSKETTIDVKWVESSYAWKVKDADIETLDGIQCVRLCARNTSLMSFLIGDSDKLKAMQKDKDFKYWATSLSGYRALMQHRNEAHERALVASVTLGDTACKLFGESTPDEKLTRRKRPMWSKLHDTQLIEVDVGGTVVNMAKPKNPRDCITMEFETDQIEAVAVYIREHGLKCVSTFKERNQTMPKGIYARQRGLKAFFVVKKSRGAYKSVSTFDDAVAKQTAEDGDEDADHASGTDDCSSADIATDPTNDNELLGERDRAESPEDAVHISPAE